MGIKIPPMSSLIPFEYSDLAEPMTECAAVLLAAERRAKRADRRVRKAQAKADRRWTKAADAARELAAVLPYNICSYSCPEIGISVTREATHAVVVSAQTYVCAREDGQ